MKFKTWHKVVLAIITPTVIVGAYYGGKIAITFIKKKIAEKKKQEPVTELVEVKPEYDLNKDNSEQISLSIEKA